MSTALYQRYLAETRELLDEMDEQTIQDADVLDESSTVLCWLFEDHLQPGVVLPHWVRAHDTAPVPEPGLRAAAVGAGGVGPSGQVHPDAAAGYWSIVGDR